MAESIAYPQHVNIRNRHKRLLSTGVLAFVVKKFRQLRGVTIEELLRAMQQLKRAGKNYGQRGTKKPLGVTAEQMRLFEDGLLSEELSGSMLGNITMVIQCDFDYPISAVAMMLMEDLFNQMEDALQRQMDPDSAVQMILKRMREADAPIPEALPDEFVHYMKQRMAATAPVPHIRSVKKGVSIVRRRN